MVFNENQNEVVNSSTAKKQTIKNLTMHSHVHKEYQIHVLMFIMELCYCCFMSSVFLKNKAHSRDDCI